jgi:hypothetical protein
MSELTELQRIQQAKAVIAQIPGGEIWLEELLIRGRPDGTISGGHCIYAYRAADAFGGKTPPQLMAPFPLSIAANEPALAAVVAAINAQAIDTVTQQEATIAELTTERETLLARIADLTASE